MLRALCRSLRFERVFPNVTSNEMTGLYQAPDGALVGHGPDRQASSASRTATMRSARARPRHQRPRQRRRQRGGPPGPRLRAGLCHEPGLLPELLGRQPAAHRASRASSPNANGHRDAPGSETVILEIAAFASNHNGGQMAFGADGFLYFSIGDGGGGNDPQGNGQNLNTMLGKIHRIDVSRTSAATSPTRSRPTTPSSASSDARGEIWAYGLRNPWRFSFDRATGAAVGRRRRPERARGDRPRHEGRQLRLEDHGGHPVPRRRQRCDRSGLILPVIDYATAGGRCSVTGGFVYRGSADRLAARRLRLRRLLQRRGLGPALRRHPSDRRRPRRGPRHPAQLLRPGRAGRALRAGLRREWRHLQAGRAGSG